jgi:hypothetical protein
MDTSANHSSLSAEEIAKALARHNKHHPANAQPKLAKPAAQAKSSK